MHLAHFRPLALFPSQVAKAKLFAHRGRFCSFSFYKSHPIWRWSDVTFGHKKRGLVSDPEPLSGETFCLVSVLARSFLGSLRFSSFAFCTGRHSCQPLRPRPADRPRSSAAAPARSRTLKPPTCPPQSSPLRERNSIQPSAATASLRSPARM